MKKEYRCIGGPMDGETVIIDRDEIPYLTTEPKALPDHTVATYTLRRDMDTGEWCAVWDELLPPEK